MALFRFLINDPCLEFRYVPMLFSQGYRVRHSDLAQPMSDNMKSKYIRPWCYIDGNQSGGSRYQSNQDSFKAVMDVQQFAPHEITVKTVENQVIVEGKHEEREDEHGHVARHFVRRYQLPKGVKKDSVKSTLSSDGVLTVSATRKPSIEQKNVRNIPISLSKLPAFKNL